MPLLRVAYGKNDLLFAHDGAQYIDMVTSTGAVFLGHANDAVNRCIVEQLEQISCSWTVVTDIQDRCKEIVGHHIDDRLHLYSLYSSGTEAADVAMRIAFHQTGRTGIVGFQHNFHGKAVANQNITGGDPEVPLLDRFRQVPFLPEVAEPDILSHLERAIASTDTAAVYVEPMQGQGGGRAASKTFYSEVQALCAAKGALIICDEVFTGFYRTGSCFRYPALGIEPDIVLVGKAFANGFPASGVLLSDRFGLHPKDFRFNSTFSDNPLASAAVVGAVTEMERIDVEARVARIERRFQSLGGIPSVQMRLNGAACFLELDSVGTASRVTDHLFSHQVLVAQRGAIIGFLPPATISDEHLDHAVTIATEILAGLS